MALDWLPTARRAPIAGQPGFAWQVDCPPKILWHTTEGGNTVPSYTPGLKAPHATILAKAGGGVDVVQHIPLTLASYSLMHPAGTPPTNGAHVFQFELAGTSELGGPGYYWPNAADAVLRDLYAKVVKPIQDAYGVQLVAPTFKAYPASYGANGVRLSAPAFLAWRGHLGHMHAPGNNHGDPGLFPWARLVQIATGDDMPTLDEIGQLLDTKLAADRPHTAEAVWAASFGVETAADRLLKASRPPQPPTAEQIAAAIAAQFKTLPAGAATLDDPTIAKLAAAVWDMGATRLVR